MRLRRYLLIEIILKNNPLLRGLFFNGPTIYQTQPTVTDFAQRTVLDIRHTQVVPVLQPISYILSYISYEKDYYYASTFATAGSRIGYSHR